jgi:hypothetical protein
VLPRLSYIRFTTTIGTRADITDEPTVATLATTVETTVAITVATSRVWTAISISPDLTVSKLLKSRKLRSVLRFENCNVRVAMGMAGHASLRWRAIRRSEKAQLAS